MAKINTLKQLVAKAFIKNLLHLNKNEFQSIILLQILINISFLICDA
jgi:hypothetical protein